jgi:leishmanolysin
MPITNGGIPEAGSGFRIEVTSPQLTAAQSKLVAAARAQCSKVVVAPPPAVPADAVLTVEVRATPLEAGRNAATQTDGRWAGTSFPSRATIWIQQKALPQLEQNGLLANIVAHEIFHCLGFGLAWKDYPALVKDVAGEGLVFRGPAALTEYKLLLEQAERETAVSGVPIEMEGGAGQGGMHWRESVFGDELMSSKQQQQPGKLSAMTIASLADLGYRVEPMHADPYRL